MSALCFVVGCDDEQPLPAEPIVNDDDDDMTSGGSSDPSDPSATSNPSDPTTPTDTNEPTDTNDPSDPSTTTDPSESDTDDPTRESDTDDPTTDTTGEPNEPCTGKTANVTAQGFVTASSVFDTVFGPAYEPEFGVDGDLATSWFSEGPNVDGTASSYEWYTQLDHCIDEISLYSNEMHSNPDFHEGFGFSEVLIEVVDTSGDVVFSEEVSLEGTPDPNITVNPGGVLGHQVLLSLLGHESEDCGGFSELVIDGREQR